MFLLNVFTLMFLLSNTLSLYCQPSTTHNATTTNGGKKKRLDLFNRRTRHM